MKKKVITFFILGNLFLSILPSHNVLADSRVVDSDASVSFYYSDSQNQESNQDLSDRNNTIKDDIGNSQYHLLKGSNPNTTFPKTGEVLQSKFTIIGLVLVLLVLAFYINKKRKKEIIKNEETNNRIS